MFYGQRAYQLCEKTWQQSADVFLRNGMLGLSDPTDLYGL